MADVAKHPGKSALFQLAEVKEYCMHTQSVEQPRSEPAVRHVYAFFVQISSCPAQLVEGCKDSSAAAPQTEVRNHFSNPVC